MKNRTGRGGRASRRHEHKAAEIQRRIELFTAATGVAVSTLEELTWEVLDWFRLHPEAKAKVRLEGTRAVFTGRVHGQPWLAVFDVVLPYGYPPAKAKDLLKSYLSRGRENFPQGMKLYPITAFPRESENRGS